jgi:hypothetical protein
MSSTPDLSDASESPEATVESAEPVLEEAEQLDVTVESEPLPEPDERLLAAHDLALAALREIGADDSVGDAVGYTVEPDGVVSLRFANRLHGYPGWFWTVSLARVEDAEPTVLEVELLPGEGALLAPDWVPWAERLADYQAAQVALAEAEADDLEGDADLDDVEDLDAADFDLDGSSILHAGDVDGVDIDELADSDEDDDEDSEFEDDSVFDDGRADDDDADDSDFEDEDEDEDSDDDDSDDDDSDDDDSDEEEDSADEDADDEDDAGRA